MTVTRSRLTSKAATVEKALRMSVQGVLEPVRIVLPFPPSGHTLFKRYNGSMLSEAYRKWRDTAGWELLAQKPKKTLGRVGIHLVFRSPDNRRRDIDNLLKPVIDLLVKHSLIEGDDSRFLRILRAEWDDIAIEPGVVVIIKPAVF